MGPRRRNVLLMLRSASSGVPKLAQWNDTAGAAGAVGMEAVVMGCREPHRGVVGQWRGLARSGCRLQTGQAGGHFDMLGFAAGGRGGLRRCHGVVTSGAKHGGTEGRYVETICAGQREGRDNLGRVNMVSR